MDEVKDEVVSILMTEAKGMTARQLIGKEKVIDGRNNIENYQELVGERIPFARFGFPSVEALMRALSDTVRITRGAGGEELYLLIPTEKTQHMAAMKRREKTKKARRGKPVRQRQRKSAGNGWMASGPARPLPVPFRQFSKPNTTLYRAPNPGNNIRQPSASARQVFISTSQPARFFQPGTQPRVAAPVLYAPSRSKAPVPAANTKNVQQPQQVAVNRMIDARALLENYAKQCGVDSLVFRTMSPYHQKEGFVSSVTLLGEIYGSIEVCRTRHQAEQLAAQRACQALKLTASGITFSDASGDSRQGQNVNADELKRIVVEVLKNHPAGLLSTALEVKVKEKCGAVPANFLTIVDGWGDILEINPVPGKNWKIIAVKMEAESVMSSSGAQSKVTPKISPTDVLVMPKSSEWEVYVCCVNSTVDVVVRLVGDEYSTKLDELEAAMSEGQYDSDTRGVAVNTLCALRSTDDTGEVMYSRVLVTNIEHNQKVRVSYVDHGGSDVESLSNLRPLPSQFCKLPFQAFACKLTGLEQFSKNSFIRGILLDRTVGKTFNAHVDDGVGRVSLTLFDVSSDEDVNVNEEVTQTLRDSELKPSLPQVSETCEVMVTHVTPAGEIYVQIIGPGFQRLRQLVNDLEAAYSGKMTDQSLFVKLPLVDHVYVVQSGAHWHRAKIMQVFSNNEVEVFMVDYGLTEIVSLAVVRLFSDEVMALHDFPHQAVVCYSQDYKPQCGMWNAGVSDLVMEQVTGQCCLLEVLACENNATYVDLLLKNADGEWLSVFNDILQQEFSASLEVQITNFLSSNTTMSSSPPPLVDTDLTNQVAASVGPTNQQQAVEGVTQRLSGLQVGQKSAQLSLPTSQSFSSSVTSTASQPVVSPVTSTVSLPVRLPVMSTASLPVTSTASLPVRLPVTSTASLPVRLPVSSTASLPVASPLPPHVTVTQPPIEQLVDGDIVIVTWPISPSNVVLLKAANKPKLQQMHEDMSKLAVNSALAAFGAVPGLMVAVYVAEEDLWFRAVVEEFQPGHQVKVYLGDYCDRQVVSLTQVRILPANFCTFPWQGVRARLAGIKSVGRDWSDEAVAWFTEFTKAKQMKVRPTRVAHEVLLLVETGQYVNQLLIDRNFAVRL